MGLMRQGAAPFRALRFAVGEVINRIRNTDRTGYSNRANNRRRIRRGPYQAQQAEPAVSSELKCCPEEMRLARRAQSALVTRVT
jgi:hypothetical protein